MKYITKFLLLFIAVGVISCSEDFLESQPTQFISADKMAEAAPFNPDIFNGQVSGLYSLMYQTGTGGTDLQHDDFGQKSWDIYMGLLSGNMALQGYNYGWYRRIAQFTAPTDNNQIENYMPWRYYYRIIRSANTIIEGLGGNDVTPELQEQKYQMGQAKAMRAYSYFYLAQLFANEYDPAAGILPLYTSTDQEGLPLSTGAEVWGLVKDDLEDAVTLLDGYARNGKQEVNQDVARGLLAYTYLTMGDYTNAALTAQAVIDGGYAIVPKDLVVGGPSIPQNAFSYINGAGADWVWGMDLTLDQGLDLVSWWGQVDYFTYSYGAIGDGKIVDVGLLNSIRPSDVRSGWFVSRFCLNKFYHEERTHFNQREITADYVYMRVEEMHLIKAEALAFAGDDDGAQTALEALVTERDDDPSYISSLTGDDLKDEIYQQWRIEMWGEGKSYMAMKRFEKTIVREGHIDFDGVPIPYNDDRLTLEIPYQEVQDNPNI